VLPAITGTATVGETLTASTGTWTGREAPGNFTYQWMADAVAIEGATAPTFVLTADELAAVITVTVSAANWKGAVSATSAATAAVAAA